MHLLSFPWPALYLFSVLLFFAVTAVNHSPGCLCAAGAVPYLGWSVTSPEIPSRPLRLLMSGQRPQLPSQSLGSLWCFETEEATATIQAEPSSHRKLPWKMQSGSKGAETLAKEKQEIQGPRKVTPPPSAMACQFLLSQFQNLTWSIAETKMVILSSSINDCHYGISEGDRWRLKQEGSVTSLNHNSWAATNSTYGKDELVQNHILCEGKN